MKKEYRIAKFRNPTNCPFRDYNGFCGLYKDGAWRLQCVGYDINLKVHFPDDCPLEKVIE